MIYRFLGVRMSEPDGQLVPTAEIHRSTSGHLCSDPCGELTDDVSAGALLREIARIEDAVLAVHHIARPGDLLGQYRIIRLLGQGTTGIVYEAEDRQLSRKAALKVLALSSAGDDDRRRRLRREARAASAVVHPNVAAVYGVGHARGLDYLAMEFVAGVTLSEGRCPVRC